MTQHISPLEYTRFLNYRRILAEIALDKGFPEFSAYIGKYDPTISTRKNVADADASLAEEIKEGEPNDKDVHKYNITVMPGAHCDGCE